MSCPHKTAAFLGLFKAPGKPYRSSAFNPCLEVGQFDSPLQAIALPLEHNHLRPVEHPVYRRVRQHRVDHYTCRLLGLNYEDFTYHRLSPPDIPRTYLVFPLHAKSRHPFTILLKFQDLKITLVDAPHPPHVKYITIGPIVSSRELPDLLLARRYVLVKDTFTYIRVADRRARHFLFGAVNSYNRTSGNTS